MTVAAWQIWLAVALVLALLELAGAHFILLGLAIAAAAVALIAGFVPATGFAGQLLIFAIAAAFTVPAIVMVFRRYFPNNLVNVVNEPGGRAGEPRPAVERNGRIGVEIYGDFYPAEFSSGLTPEPGTQVVVTEFRGIVARVRAASDPEEDTSRNP